MDRARRATEALQEATSAGTSAIKDPDRKPHLVSFGVNGALNQGVSSTNEVRKGRKSTKDVAADAAELVRQEVVEKKRKREKLDIADAESPPSKRQSVSPMAANSDDYDNGDLPVHQESPAIEASKPLKTKSKRRTAKPPKRPSSQTSKVDKNGSPLAASQEDHFSKLRQRLSEDRDGDKSQVTAPPSFVQSPLDTKQRGFSGVFGPKVELEKKTKARKFPPEEVATRYVAHEKTGDGVYQDVATKQVVAPQKKLQDPFTEQNRKSTEFTERLMSGSSAEKHVRHKNEANTIDKEKRKIHDVETADPQALRASKINRLPELARRMQPAGVRDRRRVEVENYQLSDDSTPSEMTMGTSYASQASEPDGMRLSGSQNANQEWNVAIRPHYTHLHEAVHRIADVSPAPLRCVKADVLCRKLSSGCRTRKT